MKEYEYCPNCQIGLNSQEKNLRICKNCEHSWDKLKVKEEITFEEWCEVNDIVKVAFNMFMKDGDCLSLGKVSDMYEVYCDTF